MKTKSIIAIFLIATSLQLFAQAYRNGLYIPREFQKAYEKGTRKLDGNVSATYWQNRSEYKLKARIDPYKTLLHGEATITYYNNSPDTICRPTFHTYHDYYKQGAARLCLMTLMAGTELYITQQLNFITTIPTMK